MNEDELPDELNPQHLFSLTATDLLVKILNGAVDAAGQARQELRNRGLDDNGNWIGFQAL